MTITSTQSNAIQNPNLATGSYADDAGSPAAMVVDVGFVPRYVLMSNRTTRVQIEWFEGMTAAHGIKMIANGTRSLETSACITVGAGGLITFPAAAQNDVVSWQAVR
jgi:hypothetical protein